jgi:DNA-binding winged helix-turn-helix (wHTH) protein
MQNTADYLTFGQWRYLRTVGQLQPLSASAEPEVFTLEPRLHQLLNFFLDHKDLVVSREQILTSVWGEGLGSDESLSRAVAALRRALQDSRLEPTYIATLSKKGYCWLAPVAAIELPPEPVAEQLPPADLLATQQALDVWHQGKKTKLLRIRYIWFSTLLLLLFSLSFALLLSQMNEKATLPRYLQVTPASALDGKEQSPLLSADKTVLVFQHQLKQQSGWRWVVQQLPSMQSQQDSQYYQALSQPQWLDSEQILYRAIEDQDCAFWSKTIKQNFQPAQPLFSCHQFISAGQVMTADGLYWLDLDPATGRTQLWLWQQGKSQRLLLQFPAEWRGVSHILVKENKAYLLAQVGYSYSWLLELNLTDLNWQKLREFDFSANQLAWWSEHDLLVNKSASQLQVVSLRTENTRIFGEMTFNLAQSSVWEQSLLAVYPAMAVTDLWQLQWLEQNNQITTLPFAESNRSERSLLVQQDYYYFISERSGLPQIWRSKGDKTEQLSQFKNEMAIQQLLWLDDKLLLLIDRQLFHFSEQNGDLTPFTQRLEGSERFVVCDNSLYWTSRSETGWSLNHLRQGGAERLAEHVVNVQCGPDLSLILQMQQSPVLKQWRQGQQQSLAVQINWRTTDEHAWTSNSAGLYWLSEQGRVLNYYDWQSTEQQQWPLPEQAQALVAGKDKLFVQQFRAQDTDIVWLHPEP